MTKEKVISKRRGRVSPVKDALVYSEVMINRESTIVSLSLFTSEVLFCILSLEQQSTAWLCHNPSISQAIWPGCSTSEQNRTRS